MGFSQVQSYRASMLKSVRGLGIPFTLILQMGKLRPENRIYTRAHVPQTAFLPTLPASHFLLLSTVPIGHTCLRVLL